MCLIEEYVDQLRGVLLGPRRAKEDLLDEATDHLLDASAAHLETGVSVEVAQERAVSEFGPVALVAPGYQEELNLVQAIRTAAAMLIGIGIQPMIWQGLWPQIARAPVIAGGTARESVSRLVESLGTLGIILAVLGVIAARTGMRIPAVRHHVVKAVGTAGLIIPASAVGLAVLLTALSPSPARFLQPATALSLTLFALVPMAAIAYLARRCLQPR